VSQQKGQKDLAQSWAVSIVDTYSYDGYSVLLQDEALASANPGYTPAQATNLLYAGEYFNTDAQHYYNRARWYDPAWPKQQMA